MKKVAKYNIYKGVSTLLTFGTPIATLACCGDMFVHRSDTALSAAGIFLLLILAVIFKDKILENFKMPPVALLTFLTFVLILMIENILTPIKTVCLTTMISTGADEFTFKRLYKEIECTLPEKTKLYKKAGFIFTTTDKLEGGDK